MVGTKTKDIEDYTTKDHNAKNTVKVIIETRPERNTMSITRKDIGLQNIIPKTIRLVTNNTVDNLYI
jgi:hypothetical protein